MSEIKKLFSLFFSVFANLHCFRYFALFSLICTVFAILQHCFRYLEAFGSWLVFAILHCFRYLEAFGSWLLSLFGSWLLFAIFDCFDTEKTNQRKQSSFQLQIINHGP